MRLSIILPATDETFSLAETVETIDRLLSPHMIEYLVVTHPKLTTSDCRVTIKTLREKYRKAIKTFDQTREGIGSAFQDAIGRAEGDTIIMMASDLETDPAVLPPMLRALSEDCDVVTTSRWRGGARFEGYNPAKLFLNFCFQLFFRILYATDLTDLTYAYRAYRATVLKTIRWEEAGFPFLFESILKPVRLGYRATEIEAPWRARSEGVSHSSFVQTLAYAWTGLRIRFQRTKKMRYSERQ